MIKTLIITPPPHSPAEPPAGAFILASSLQARGHKNILFDASILFFQRLIEKSPHRTKKSWQYLKNTYPYTRNAYKTAVGVIQKEFKRHMSSYPSWTISLSNISYTPIPPQNISQYHDHIQANETPFSYFIKTDIIPYIKKNPCEKIAISTTFINQIYFTLELAYRLNQEKIKPLLGGTLIKSIIKISPALPPLFKELFEDIETNDSHLLYDDEKKLLSDFDFPKMIIPLEEYASPLPVVPIITSKNCYYHRCEFCPDRDETYFAIPPESVFSFMERCKKKLKNPILFHIIDSSIPPSFLIALIKKDMEKNLYYGFLRFEKYYNDFAFWKHLKSKGFELAQWGFESASDRILKLYRKGSNHQLMKSILGHTYKNGIKNYLYCLFGLPLEEPGDRELTYLFLKEHPHLYDFLNLSIFNLPNDKRILENKEIWNIQLENISHYDTDFRFYLPWSDNNRNIRGEARSFIQRNLNGDKNIRRKINQVPNPLKSDHAFFFNFSDTIVD